MIPETEHLRCLRSDKNGNNNNNNTNDRITDTINGWFYLFILSSRKNQHKSTPNNEQYCRKTRDKNHERNSGSNNVTSGI